MAATLVETFAQKFFACYDCRIDEEDTSVELKVIPMESSNPPAILFPPPETLESSAPLQWGGHRNGTPRVFSPREQGLRDQIQLPLMRTYPCPPTCTLNDSEDLRMSELLRIYQEFVLDLYKGIRMTLLTSQHDYSEVHCWLSDDLRTLKLDEGSGCIIEFPLNVVSTVQRLVRKTSGGTSPASSEHVVIIEFERRKLAFAFKEMLAAQSLLVCLKVLIYQSQSYIDIAYSRTPSQNKGRICT